jgi:hypothetical protein
VDAFLTRESIAKDSAEYQRFVNVARMFTDAVDPLNVARYLQKEKLPGHELSLDRKVLIQMAELDFIIPNACTEQLSEVAEVPRIDYLGEHAFLVIPVEPAYITGMKDAAEFIEGSFEP